MLGDVLVAEQVFGYESGKVTTRGFEARPQGSGADKAMVDLAKQVQPREWALDLKESRPDGTEGRTVPAVHFGTLMSGEKVIDDPPLWKI